MTRETALEQRREEFLTVKEFAFVTRQHEQSIYRRIRQRRQPGVVRFGREIRIDITQAGSNWPQAWAAALELRGTVGISGRP